MTLRRYGYKGNMGFALFAGKLQIRLVRHQFALWIRDKALFDFSF
jgi:hypothetical protein